MREDITTRLRNWDDQQPPFKTMQEAADEIERLREELKQVKRSRDQWHADAVGCDYEDIIRAEQGVTYD